MRRDEVRDAEEGMGGCRRIARERSEFVYKRDTNRDRTTEEVRIGDKVEKHKRLLEVCYTHTRKYTHTHTHFFFFWGGLHDSILFSLLGGGISSQNSGYKITIICPFFYISFLLHLPTSILASCDSRGMHSSAPLHSSPLDPLTPIKSSLS